MFYFQGMTKNLNAPEFQVDTMNKLSRFII